MYIAWLIATASVCPVTLCQYGGGGKGTHQHFLYMYMLQLTGTFENKRTQRYITEICYFEYLLSFG